MSFRNVDGDRPVPVDMPSLPPGLSSGEPRPDPPEHLIQPQGPVHDLGHGDLLGHPPTVDATVTSAR